MYCDKIHTASEPGGMNECLYNRDLTLDMLGRGLFGVAVHVDG